jgi:hypothetical protein
MVIIHNDRGYNIGFVVREALDHEIPFQVTGGGKGKKIRYLTTLSDNGSKIRSVLESKIEAEKFALYQCLLHIRGHRLSQLAEILTAEFQFDRKKLTVYLKKHEEVSVCRLVRKLYETFKMRVKVIEVDCLETFQQSLLVYLETSGLGVSFEELLATSPSLTEKGELFLQFKSNPQSILREIKPSPEPSAQQPCISLTIPPASTDSKGRPSPPMNHLRQPAAPYHSSYPVFTHPHLVGSPYPITAYPPQYFHNQHPPSFPNYVPRMPLPQYAAPLPQYYDPHPRTHMVLMNNHTPLVHLAPTISGHHHPNPSHGSGNRARSFPSHHYPPHDLLRGQSKGVPLGMTTTDSY